MLIRSFRSSWNIGNFKNSFNIIDALPVMVLSNGRLHTTFVQTGQRPVECLPNPEFQNIPIKSDLGGRIRKSVYCGSGFVLIALRLPTNRTASCRYSFREIRSYGNIQKRRRCCTPKLPLRFLMFRRKKSTKKMRRKAKVDQLRDFIWYGCQFFARQLGGSREEAQEFYNQYFATFKGLAEYQNK